MKVILVDDEMVANESLTLIIHEYLPDIEILGTACSANEARKLIAISKPDLVFLDIEMPGEDGFELLKSLKSINFNIIFITAYNQYAIKAFKFSAIDYLLKPVKISELINAVNRVKNVMSQWHIPDYKTLLENIQSVKPVKIVLSTTESREYLSIDDIIHIEGDVNYSKFFLICGRTILVSKTLKVYEDLLIGNDFFRTHKSSLVNLKHVKRIISKEGLSIEMSDGSHALLSRQCKDDFIQAMDCFVK
jgi:two-component system LytT family response regulator